MTNAILPLMLVAGGLGVGRALLLRRLTKRIVAACRTTELATVLPLSRLLAAGVIVAGFAWLGPTAGLAILASTVAGETAAALIVVRVGGEGAAWN